VSLLIGGYNRLYALVFSCIGCSKNAFSSQVSRRASIESWRSAMAAKTAEKERKKTQKLMKRESMELKDDPSDLRYGTPELVSNEPSRQFSGADASNQIYRAPVVDDFEPKSFAAHPGTIEPLELVAPRIAPETGALASTVFSSDLQTKGKSDRCDEKSEDPVTSTNNNETKTEPNRNAMTLQPSTALPPFPAPPTPLSLTAPSPIPATPSHHLPISIPSILPVMIPTPKSTASTPTQAAPIPLQPLPTSSQLSVSTPTSSSQPSIPAPATNSLQASTTSTTVSSSAPGPNNVNSKKGQLWALPIVPKLPQKPPEKRPNSLTGLGKKMENSPAESVTPVPVPGLTSAAASSSSSASSSAASASASATAPLADVWRQAFGAAKPKKPENSGNGKPGKVEGQQQQQGSDGAVVKKCEKTFLDIPPEVRRRPKPTFGGLIHFSPDWERAVLQHHDRCKLPASLSKRMQVHPQILTG